MTYPDVVQFAGATPVVVKTTADEGYKLTPAMQGALQAFVEDAVTKYKAGTCGK